MNELILALVALIALTVMIWKNTFKTYPMPSRLLTVGLNILIVTLPLSWITIAYCSRTLTVDSFGAAHYVISLATSAAFAIALAFMIAAVFVARNPQGIANTTNS